MAVTTTTKSRIRFVVDEHSIDRTNGVQMDWTNVSVTNSATGKKWVPAGTAVGTLLGSGKASPRVVTTNPAAGILETDAHQDAPFDSVGYGLIVGGVLYENLLPDASGTPKTLAAAVKNELNAAGTGFGFQQYIDSRAS